MIILWKYLSTHDGMKGGIQTNKQKFLTGLAGLVYFPIHSVILQRVATMVSFQQWPVLSTTLSLKIPAL